MVATVIVVVKYRSEGEVDVVSSKTKLPTTTMGESALLRFSSVSATSGTVFRGRLTWAPNAATPTRTQAKPRATNRKQSSPKYKGNGLGNDWQERLGALEDLHEAKPRKTKDASGCELLVLDAVPRVESGPQGSALAPSVAVVTRC